MGSMASPSPHGGLGPAPSPVGRLSRVMCGTGPIVAPLCALRDLCCLVACSPGLRTGHRLSHRATEPRRHERPAAALCLRVSVALCHRVIVPPPPALVPYGPSMRQDGQDGQDFRAKRPSRGGPGAPRLSKLRSRAFRGLGIGLGTLSVLAACRALRFRKASSAPRRSALGPPTPRLP